MDINNLILILSISSGFFIFALVILTLYEFFKLDREQFQFYIIGLLLYVVSIICFLIQYMIFAPLSDLENLILGYGVRLSPLIGLLCFILGTEQLAKRENPDFRRNETLARWNSWSGRGHQRRR